MPLVPRIWTTGLVLVLFAGLVACGRTAAESQEAEREMARHERRARQARERLQRQQDEQASAEYHRAIAGATRPGEPPAPAGPCQASAELRRRVDSERFQQDLEAAVLLVADAGRATLITEGEQTLQRFPFTVRMHPADEPALGRKGRVTDLEVDLRWVPLCRTEGVTVHHRTLRLPVQPGVAKAGVEVRPQVRPLPPGGAPVGQELAIVLDPRHPDLLQRGPPGRKRAEAAPGLWEITEARFPDRPRLRRLRQLTTHQPRALAQVVVYEVACAGGGGGSCRFLARQQDRRETVEDLGPVLRLAAPIRSLPQALELHAILMALRYAACEGDARPLPTSSSAHACTRPEHRAKLPCQAWLAQAGYAAPPHVVTQGDRFTVSHVLTCPGSQQRTLHLEVTLTRGGDLQLRETDLASRATEFEDALRALAAPEPRPSAPRRRSPSGGPARGSP
jgi:hypothetical protein